MQMNKRIVSGNNW